LDVGRYDSETAPIRYAVLSFVNGDGAAGAVGEAILAIHMAKHTAPAAHRPASISRRVVIRASPKEQQNSGRLRERERLLPRGNDGASRYVAGCAV